MDYLFINAIVKEVYKDLPCGCPFPAEFGRTMYATVSGMDCISNPEVSDVLSLFTLKAKGQASTIVFSKIQKHTNSASVGRFIQNVGWTWNGELLRQNLDEILNVGFFTEEEINNTALRGGSFALPKDRRSAYKEIPLTFSPQVKQAILTTVLLRWLRFEAPLRIAVPKNVDYNSYVLSAMKKIYSLFPVSLRAKAGFCSYLPSDKNVPETISIGFVPEEMADSRTLCLDGSSAAVCAKLNCGTNSTPMDTFIKYISSAPENVLPSFLDEIYEDLEGSGSNEKMTLVVPRDYQAIGMALNLLTLEGSLSELVSQWNRNFFEYKEKDKIPARWQKRVLDKIRQTIDPAEFCQLAQRRLTTEGFEGLKAYRGYCDNNPELTAALWDKTVALLHDRNKTYTEIYHHVLKQKRDLAFAMDEAKMDRLFCQAVKEQLHNLRQRPAQTQNEVKALMAEAQELKVFSESRSGSGAAELQAAVQSFLKELKDRENCLIFEKMEQGFQQRKNQPHQDNIEKIQLHVEEMIAYRNKVAARNDIPGADRLLAEIDEFINTLINRKLELVHEGFAKKYNLIVTKPVKTAEQIQRVIDEAKALLEEVAAAEPFRKNAELQDTIRAFVEEKEAEINSSNVKFQAIHKILSNSTYGYFQILEELNKADKSQLEDQHWKTIQDKLQSRRPASLEAYEQGFKACYGKKLILASVAARPDYVAGILVRDICQLSKITLACTSSNSAEKNVDRIISALAIAEKISTDGEVQMTFDATPVNDPVYFKKVLMLSHTADTVGDKARLEKIIHKLVENNTFSGNEMISALAMLSRCDMDPSILFAHILRGDFRGAVEKQYRQAYELILQSYHEPVKSALASMQEKVESRRGNVDSVAYKAFESFVRERRPRESKGKGNKIMIPILSVLAVAVVALTAALVLLINKVNTSEPEPTTVPVTEATLPPETEPVLVCPEELAFYQRNMDGFRLLYGNAYVADFSVQSRRVSALLDAVDEETATMIISSYCNSHGTTVAIDDQGTTVSWDEYFFWMCWYNANQDAAGLQRMLLGEESDEPILSILQAIHGQAVLQQDYATPAADTLVDPDEPVDAAETTTTGAAEEQNEEGFVETEPVLTVSDIKADITEAARSCYEESLVYAEQLMILHALFGEDFQLDFGYHVDLVESIVLPEEAEGAVNEYILNYYNTLPANSVIRLEENGCEVAWDEYVFWECWVLAKRGITIDDENVFDSDLQEDVADVLFLIHQLVDSEEYAAALEAARALAAKMPAVEHEAIVPETTASVTETTVSTEETTASTTETTSSEAITDEVIALENTVSEVAEEEIGEPETIESPFLQAIIWNAKDSFEKAREIYKTIVDQVKIP